MSETVHPGQEQDSTKNANSVPAGTDTQVGLEVLPFIPSPPLLWRSLRFWIWAAFLILLLAAVPDIIVDYWFLDSIGKSSIFWTNFNVQLILFLIGLVLFTLGDYIPIRTYAVSPTLINAGLHIGLWNGIFAGWLLSRTYQQFLLMFNAQPFGKTDPVFGHDLSFYIFYLPAIWTIVMTLMYMALDSAFAFLLGRYDQLKSSGILERDDISFWGKLGMMITPGLNLALFLLGITLVAETFLSRYSLLFKDNEESGVRVGAEFLDVDGFFSTLNMIHVSVIIEIGFMITMGYALYRIAKHYNEFLTPGSKAKKKDYPLNLRRPIRAAILFLAIDLVFFLGVIIKDHVIVSPNEPSIQIPYIQRHMDATLTGYQLNDIRTVDWRPPKDPLNADQIAASKTVQNAPILTPFVSYMEEPPDVQHYERIQASESLMVFGPMLDIFIQEQQLRPYYQILNVDGVRYNVDGEKKMYVSAARELPSLAFLGPKEWLRYWGSAALMFTHGLGLVVAPVNAINEEGGPVYVSHSVPPKVETPALETEPRIYFGEGMKDDYILTNIRHLKELDHATSQFREEFVFPADIKGGIRVDSAWKRLILAFHTKDVTAFLFSEFIDHNQTRVHLYRTPIRRIARIAPFLFLDTNIFAFIADKKILWMMNGLTTTDQYPYSYREALGDKSDERALEKFPERMINYAEDSVKVTVDAYTGEPHFYKIANDPIVNAWDKIYPGLFENGSSMPKPVKAQLTYPLQWFHIQFDDIYKRYHQRNPIEFYNVEDIWDDADEVLGSLGRGLTEFGTTDQMTFSYEGTNLLIDPADLPKGTNVGKAGELQYTMLMPFTCEGCRNLRSLILAFQDPDTYGKLVNLRIPQGTFVAGPEQVDTYIDDDAQVNQQITMWVRHGSEVVRGHTLILPVKGDVVYVEPLYIISLQNPLPEVKLFSVNYRGRTTMATTLDKALRLQSIPEAAEQQMNMLPWFEEDKRRDQ